MGDEPFAVLLGDDVVYNQERPALCQLMDVYERYEGTVLGCQLVPVDQVSLYDIMAGEQVDGDSVLRVLNMVEKPNSAEASSNMVVLG